MEGKNIKINIHGDLNECSADVRTEMMNIIELTKNHKDIILNICFAYDSEFEIESALLKDKIL